MSGANKECGVFGKYILRKANGDPCNSNACYFVLRLDTDYAARLAMRVYADKCNNPKLRDDIYRCVNWLDNPPKCNCGGRDRDIDCPFHDDGRFGNPAVWRHGGKDGE